MNNYDFQVWAQIIKTGILILFYIIILTYVFKKLINAFIKGTANPINPISVSRLLSLGLTVLLLSSKVNNLFESIFYVFTSSFDYLSNLIGPQSGIDYRNSDFFIDFSKFQIADAIIIFAVWLFINTILNFFFQSADASNSSRIFSDKLLAKNTFVVFLLVFSIYLSVASIVAIPEFQALESSVYNDKELTEFAEEVNQQTGNNRDDLLLKELSTNDLKLKESLELYSDFNSRIISYNEIINNIWEVQEQRKNKAIDAYKSAILEKTAAKERIKYRSQLKNWIQGHSDAFSFFVYSKPRFENILRGVVINVTRIEKDSLLRVNDSRVDSLYQPSFSSLEDWEMHMRDLERIVFNTRSINYSYSIPPAKPKIGEQYGIFRLMSGWLLSTESMSLALIVGLFAFGLLGSIGSTFIRERIKTGSDADIKDLIPNLPAVLINGVSSAIVVFLAVKGMLVVFSGEDKSINPYVLFFTCLVAAVFSEDIWKWAHNKLKDQFNNHKDLAQHDDKVNGDPATETKDKAG